MRMEIIVTRETLTVFDDNSMSIAEWRIEGMLPSQAWAIIDAIRQDDREAIDSLQAREELAR